MRVLFTGGSVLTGTTGSPRIDAVGVQDGRIVALGDDARSWASSSTNTIERVDLTGRCVVPGFRDGHVHPLSGGTELVSLSLAQSRSVEDVLAAVRAHASAHPGDPWIVGGSYSPTLLPGGVGDATVLDAVVPDRPVALYSADHHVLWVNSAALDAAGISASTPEPALGTIVRHGDGSPIGTLLEWGAMELVERVMPDPDPALRRLGLAAGIDTLLAEGIVWAQDAAVDEGDLAVYAEAARAGTLRCRINGAFRSDPRRWVAQREQFRELRDGLRDDARVSGQLTARTVKFFADGVIEAGTGFLLEPYEDGDGCGLPNWSPAGLAEAVRAFDADGFQIHIHAIGDGGVRMALDAIEHALQHNGRRDRRPVIAHTQLVDPADRPRFASLGVIANFEPLWSCLDPVMTDLTLPRLGPRRSMLQYPVATIAGHGAAISFGSDWPVSSVRPLDGLAVAVTRQTPDGRPDGGWMPEERLPIDQALQAYTRGTAHQAFDDDAGRIAVGQRADLCVLSDDITAMSGGELPGVMVDETWINGAATYRRS
ncbi:MAG: amidohydrolase [Acidimicrobiia bacterium]